MGAALLWGASSATAADTATSSLQEMASNDSFLWMILTLEIILILIGLVLIVVILKMKSILFGAEEAEGAEAVESVSFFEKWASKLQDAVPVDREEEIMTDHEYDGIIELDNNLPPWWKMLFNLSILFAAIYIGFYHLSDAGPSSEEEYLTAMEEARIEVETFMAQKANSIDELNVVAVSDESALAEGKQIFQTSCAACHGKEGQGGVGPNMTDNYWLHGGDIKDVFKTIKYGVPEKGMISWKTQLSPSQMQSVASYILTLVGTNPPNPKDPQGDLYEPTEGSSDAVSSNATVEDNSISMVK
ncbi:MAG: cytochrome C oxidase subunit III [Thalassobius sp.]|nr:cytochrome C oxidase subunit III [Thalassovita sp.]